jgi:hypothetical protein
MIEEIRSDSGLLALIIRADFSEPGIQFFTPNDFSQQLAHMRHPAGKVIAPHVHNAVQRSVTMTQEVLFVKAGKLRVDFYEQDRTYLQSRILGVGDVILLASGGHGFEVLEEVRLIEVKQGPYAGEADKTRFSPDPTQQVRFDG